MGADGTIVAAGRVMGSHWIWEIYFDPGLKGFPKGLDLDTKEREDDDCR